jgi:hypothetical protein
MYVEFKPEDLPSENLEASDSITQIPNSPPTPDSLPQLRDHILRYIIANTENPKVSNLIIKDTNGIRAHRGAILIILSFDTTKLIPLGPANLITALTINTLSVTTTTRVADLVTTAHGKNLNLKAHIISI